MRRHHAAPSAVRLRLAIAVVMASLLLILAACSGSEDGSATGEPSTATPAAGLQVLAEEAPADWAGGVVDVRDLPQEAIVTLALIADDGPFPYRQDGSTFQNREGLLPDREIGFYREYTVETPGSPDRGARRLVRGEGSAVYYTEDHYDSFRFVHP